MEAEKSPIFLNLKAHSLEKREILVTEKLFREINSLVTSLVKRCFHEIFAKVTKIPKFPYCEEHTVEITEFYCHGFFAKKFVKLTFY